jgi:hypothetical protein
MQHCLIASRMFVPTTSIAIRQISMTAGGLVVTFSVNVPKVVEGDAIEAMRAYFSLLRFIFFEVFNFSFLCF